ncbi:TOG array regulator of axonemal microtubules protein 1-like [Trichomycterus rosablanca]|uniref:TOG array regulator of axonemal microtubules protein 1-like n=1 Tax=Trichomycterus rosablanca TaxID=2290929 RepID=UPI002F3542A7
MAAQKPVFKPVPPPKRTQDDHFYLAEQLTPLEASLFFPKKVKQGKVQNEDQVSANKVLAGSNQKEPVDRSEAEDTASSYRRRQTPEDLCLDSEEPLKRPDVALEQMFQLLELEDWERKIEGLKLVRALAKHHANILLHKLHEICLAVTKEVKNLRSMVARAAMSTLAHLFAHLQRAMDPELDGTALVLLQKSGESSQFVKGDAEMALNAMVISCSSGRVLNALLAGGLSHRNAAVRTCMTLQLEKLAEVVGASQGRFFPP